MKWLPAVCIALSLLAESACSHTATNTAQTSVATPSAAAAVQSATPAPAPASGNALTSSGQADLGPDAIEDGIVAPGAPASSGDRVASAGETAAGLLSAGTAPAAAASPDPVVALVAAANDALPLSEYSLTALAQTQPSDAVALDTFVRDGIGIDVYDGVLRGALGAWLGRAGNPDDKLLLLAALLRAKRVAFQFVRGTLSDAERTSIVDEAKSAPRFIVEPVDARPKAYLDARAEAGRHFATWIGPKLGATVVALPDSVAAVHYWLRVADAAGKPLDLDPTLHALTAGAHLGTEDATNSTSAALPSAEYWTVDVRVRSTAAAGTQAPIVEAQGHVADIAFAPVNVILRPSENDAVIAAVLIGARSVQTKTVASAGIVHLDLDVIRTAPGGAQSAITRTIYDAKSAAGSLAAQGVDMHTIVVYPESAPAFLGHTEFGDAAVLANGAAMRRAGTDPGEVSFYPKPIADFISIDDALAATLGASANVRLYHDRPDVVMLHTTIRDTGAAQGTVHTIFDIADNGMTATGDKAAVVAANLARGWADTRVERDIAIAPNDSAMDRWLAAKSSHDTFRSAVGMPATTSFAHAVTLGTSAFWWDVDATSGSAVGREPGGYGEVGEEVSTLTIGNVASAAWRAVKLGWTILGVYSTASDCLSSVVSANCALDAVGMLSSGLGLFADAKGAAALGRVGNIIMAGQYASAVLASGPNTSSGSGAANGPNACGPMCSPGDPNTSDGDGP